MSDMKCPFCGKEMLCGGTICRYDPDCPIYDKPVPTEVLELLDHTKKKLDIAVEELTKIKIAAESVGIGFFMTAAIVALAKIKNAEQINQKEEK